MPAVPRANKLQDLAWKWWLCESSNSISFSKPFSQLPPHNVSYVCNGVSLPLNFQTVEASLLKFTRKQFHIDIIRFEYVWGKGWGCCLLWHSSIPFYVGKCHRLMDLLQVLHLASIQKILNIQSISQMRSNLRTVCSGSYKFLNAGLRCNESCHHGVI
jgi:hypothetical protein